MPCLSARKKAVRAANCQNALKRWKKDNSDPTCAAGDSPQQVAGEPRDAAAARFHPAPTQSAASFRHSLLPPEYANIQEVSENSGIYNISHKRLSELLDLVSCVECGTKSTFNITSSYFDCTISVKCDNCQTGLLHSEPEKCKHSDLSKGNVMHVYHSLSEGYGRLGLSRLSAGMGTKEMSSKTYTKCAQYLYTEMEEFYSEMQVVAKNCVENLYEKQGIEKDSEGILNIDVSFDGTWLTRGDKSHIGAAFVMDIPSGLALDFEVLSNFCRPCSINKKKKDQKSFEEWHTTHAEKCQLNFSGLSGAMEAEGAVRMWRRSEDKGLRYVTFLGDGDSSSFKAVTNMNEGEGPYKDVQVKKEECVNHVQKRMGTRLRKLKEELKEEKTTKTGKVIRSLVGGKHQLTDKQIDAYQRYFGKAIRDSVGTNTLTMKLKVMSAFWHSISTDENPHHVHCDSSWCVFKKASEENKPLPSHSSMKNYLRLDKKYENRVREIFFELSSPALLERCLKGGSQNKNESLHSKLWYHQSKSKFAGLKRIQFVTRLTILDHNFGFVANKFLQRLDFPESPEGLLTKGRMDQRKTALRSSKRRKLDFKSGPDYQPGGF